MAEFPIRIPKVSMAIHEAILLAPCVDDGQKVEEEAPLFVIETDKVETEISSPTTGVVRWTAAFGETYAVGTQVGFIETDDD